MASFQDAISKINGQPVQATPQIKSNMRALPSPTTTTSSELKIGLQFNDGDNRLIGIQNPKPNITTQDFATLLPLLQGVFVGDKTGAPLSGYYTAYREDSTKVSQVIYTE